MSINNGLQATCDDCGGVFGVDIRENIEPGGVIIRSFKCTECDRRYFVSTTNKPIRKIHEKMGFLRQGIGKASREGDSEGVNRMSLELNTLEDESKRLMDELKYEMEGDNLI